MAVAESGLPPCASMCAAWTFGNAGIGPRVPKVSCKKPKEFFQAISYSVTKYVAKSEQHFAERLADPATSVEAPGSSSNLTPLSSA